MLRCWQAVKHSEIAHHTLTVSSQILPETLALDRTPPPFPSLLPRDWLSYCTFQDIVCWAAA